MKVEIIIEYNRLIENFFSRNLSRKEDIEDLTQDVLFVLINELNSKSKVHSLKSWLYGVCRNKLYYFYNKRKRLSDLNQSVYKENLSKLSYDSTDLSSIEIDNLKLILNTRERNIFEAFYVNKYKISEISELFDIPVGTIKYLLHNIRRDLRNHIQNTKLRTEE
jgi:RNA polymerase sigma-70 factor (ECF subfamily)